MRSVFIGFRKGAYNEVIVCFMTLQMMLSQTVFSAAQHFFELMILLSLSIILLLRNKYEIDEVLLLVVFIFSQIGSFFLNDLHAFLLNFKQLGLAVLSVLYCRKYVSDSVMLHSIFALCLFLVLAQYFFTDRFPLPVGAYLTTMKDWMNYHPLGLFFNYHLSSYFLSVCLIGYAVRKRLFFLDYYVVYLMGVKTTLISFFMQKLILYSFPFVRCIRWYFIQVILVLGMVVFASQFSGHAIDILRAVNLYHGTSADIIFAQLLDVDLYLNAISVFPQDIDHFYANNTRDHSAVYGGEDHYNEIFLVALLAQSGVFLGFMFLHFLLKSLPLYRVFILLSIFHFAYILSPLVIYAMYMFMGHTAKNAMHSR